MIADAAAYHVVETVFVKIYAIDVLKLDKVIALEARILDRFADVTKRFELATFKRSWLFVKAEEFIVTMLPVELAAAVYPSMVDVNCCEELPATIDDVRFAFAKASMACTLEFISMSLDRLKVAIERLLEAALYASMASRLERFAAVYVFVKRVLSAADSVATAVIRAIFVDNNTDFVFDSAAMAALRLPLTMPRGFPRMIALFMLA